MKRSLVVLFIACLACGFAWAGNGADYNLQVIAFDNCPAGDFTDTSRHQIAVQANWQFRSCEEDVTQGCETDSDCVGNCVEIGECSNDKSKCEVDSECYEDVCDQETNLCGDGMTTCTDDFDCNPGVYCGAGVVPQGKNWDTLSKINTILLAEGDDFWVEDGNACDENGAKFHMPSGVYGGYEVWIRLVGRPGTKVGITLCGTGDGFCDGGTCTDGTTACDEDLDCPDNIFCSLNSVVRVRESRKAPSWSNVTDELLTMEVCVEAPCTKRASYETIEVFDPEYEDFFWNWNTKGKAHAQLRFFAIEQ